MKAPKLGLVAYNSKILVFAAVKVTAPLVALNPPFATTLVLSSDNTKVPSMLNCLVALKSAVKSPIVNIFEVLIVVILSTSISLAVVISVASITNKLKLLSSPTVVPEVARLVKVVIVSSLLPPLNVIVPSEGLNTAELVSVQLPAKLWSLFPGSNVQPSKTKSPSTLRAVPSAAVLVFPIRERLKYGLLGCIIVWAPAKSYFTVPVPQVKVPKSVTTPPSSRFPSPLNITVPPFASNSPLASKIPLALSISKVEDTVDFPVTSVSKAPVLNVPLVTVKVPVTARADSAVLSPEPCVSKFKKLLVAPVVIFCAAPSKIIVPVPTNVPPSSFQFPSIVWVPVLDSNVPLLSVKFPFKSNVLFCALSISNVAELVKVKLPSTTKFPAGVFVEFWSKIKLLYAPVGTAIFWAVVLAYVIVPKSPVVRVVIVLFVPFRLRLPSAVKIISPWQSILATAIKTELLSLNLIFAPASTSIVLKALVIDTVTAPIVNLVVFLISKSFVTVISVKAVLSLMDSPSLENSKFLKLLPAPQLIVWSADAVNLTVPLAAVKSPATSFQLPLTSKTAFDAIVNVPPFIKKLPSISRVWEPLIVSDGLDVPPFALSVTSLATQVPEPTIG